MKNYRDKRTGLIYCAFDRQHIKWFDNNPNYEEIKEEKVEDKKPKSKKNKDKVEESSTFDSLNEEK